MTQKQLTNIIAESISNYLLNEEDGRMGYIGNVLNRFGVKFDYGTDPEHDDDFITVTFENDAQKRDVVQFLAQMGYFQNEARIGENTVSFSRSKTLNEEQQLSKKDVMDIVKKDKEFEKKIKDIVRDTVTDLFRVLYQHNGIFKTLGK